MKRAMNILITAAFAIGLFGAAALTLYLPDREITPISPIDEFAAFMDKRVPILMRLYGIPGVNIALVRDGQIVYTAAYGDADKRAGRKMSVDMPMRVQSISKSVTAWAVLKLAEEGKLNLDDPIEKYLNGWKLPASDYPLDRVTIRQLLSHTAGLPLGDVFTLYSPDEAMPSLEESLTKTAILFQLPGKSFSYSNVGYNLLELMVESVTGRDFAEYMKTEILNPLGMYHSDLDRLSEDESVSLVKKNQDNLQLSEKQFRRWAGKRYIVLIRLANTTIIEPFAIDKSNYGNMDDWLPVEDINNVKI